ncbi:MAG: hypothetical protein OEY07_12135 [Gammaproteobacteria bacterium]|nr:hypothetical protein [Gammaproteobacteria bacterium]
MPKTLPEVFIIESLTFDDEKQDLFEGRILSDILRKNDKEPIYYYIRTQKELVEVLKLFEESRYRYLHISCHGGKTSMETTLDSIPFDELGDILRPHLKYKRLFLSACNMVNNTLARHIMQGGKCHSIIGPFKPVYFNESAIFWASFYHLMFNENESSMRLKDLMGCIKKLNLLYNIPLNYYTISKQHKQGYSYRKVTARSRS